MRRVGRVTDDSRLVLAPLDCAPHAPRRVGRVTDDSRVLSAPARRDQCDSTLKSPFAPEFGGAGARVFGSGAGSTGRGGDTATDAGAAAGAAGGAGARAGGLRGGSARGGGGACRP